MLLKKILAQLKKDLKDYTEAYSDARRKEKSAKAEAEKWSRNVLKLETKL